jgi:hypothetical protein
MPKSIYFTDEAYQQITEAARQCGFRVSRGRGSQIALFVVAAANTACIGRGLQPPAKQVASTAKVINPAKVTGKRQPRQ